MSKRTPAQTALLLLGALIMAAGLVGVVVGFTGFGDSSADIGGTGPDRSMVVFAAGAFAMVVGFGIIGFTRAAIMTGNGGYSRITIEQGVAPSSSGGSGGGGRFCSSCGTPISASARFCDSCGAAVG